jgi:hypothetical protein
VVAHDVKAAILLFFSLLDERQRRLFAGLEALKIGRGGDARVAALLGVDPHTVAKGRVELLGEDIDVTRVRKIGGGRRAAEKNSAIRSKIEEILRDEVAGDPIDGTRWTRKTTQSIAEELFKHGIEISANTVGRLLHEMDFSLRTNRKNIESGFKRKYGDHAKRNRQFMLIAARRRKFETSDLPIISVDGKKRELIGNFKNGGCTWRRKAREVKDHDFPSDAEGVALPYGIYDVRRNNGMIVVGTSRETPEFAVDAIEHWWRSYGKGTTSVPVSFSSSPTPAGPTVPVASSGSAICSRNSAISTGCASPSVIIRLALQSGIRSSIHCSARSARTGRGCPSRPTMSH